MRLLLRVVPTVGCREECQRGNAMQEAEVVAQHLSRRWPESGTILHLNHQSLHVVSQQRWVEGSVAAHFQGVPQCLSHQGHREVSNLLPLNAQIEDTVSEVMGGSSDQDSRILMMKNGAESTQTRIRDSRGLKAKKPITKMLTILIDRFDFKREST